MPLRAWLPSSLSCLLIFAVLFGVSQILRRKRKMAGAINLTDKQHVAAGITILDEDGQPFATLPAGVVAAFASSDPAVADFVVGPDGMNGDVTSGKVGSATLTATVTFGDGATKVDTLDVVVTNSAPGSVSFTAGTPVEE